MPLCKLFNQKFVSCSVIAILFVVFTASCSQSADTDAVCDSAERWNEASTGFAEISSDFETTSPLFARSF